VIAALLIAAAGALGTLARYLAALGAQRLLGVRFPYGTFAVNVIGSFIIGAAMTYFVSREAMDSHLRMALTIGFLGGFTTYSSFAFETVQMLEKRQLGAATTYVGLTLVTAALACYAGIVAARGR
jgi:CrcB protein